MTDTSNSRRGRLSLAALVGGIGGSMAGWLLHALALRAGGIGSSGVFITVLGIAGVLLAPTLCRLLDWAAPQESGSANRWGHLAPWIVVPLSLAWLLIPFPRTDNPGSPLGLYKHLLALTWISGVALLAIGLLRPLASAPNPRRAACLLGALALLVAPAPVLNPPSESDEGDYVAASLAWASTGTPRVRTIVENGALERYYFDKLPITWLDYRDLARREPGAVPDYSYRMPLYPLAIAPFTRGGLIIDTPMIRWWLASLPTLAAYAALAGALAGLVGSGPRSGWALIALATATPLLYFTTNLQPEVAMAAAVATALRLGISHRSGIPCVSVAVLSALLHERMLAFALPMVAWQWWIRPSERHRILWAAGLAFIPVLAGWWATFQFRIPSRLPHAYGAKTSSFWNPIQWSQMAFLHFFSFRIGLFTHIPILLVIPVALLHVLRGRAAGPGSAARAGVTVFAFYFLVLVTYPHSRESWPHVRYLVPALPLLAPLMAWAANSIGENDGGRRLMALLLAAQTLRSIPFLAVPQLWRAIGLWFPY